MGKKNGNNKSWNNNQNNGNATPKKQEYHDWLVLELSKEDNMPNRVFGVFIDKDDALDFIDRSNALDTNYYYVLNEANLPDEF